jgi:hypothetical protein
MRRPLSFSVNWSTWYLIQVSGVMLLLLLPIVTVMVIAMREVGAMEEEMMIPKKVTTMDTLECTLAEQTIDVSS